MLQSFFKDTLSSALDWALPGTCLGCGVLLPRRSELIVPNVLLKQLLSFACPVCAARAQHIRSACPCQRRILMPPEPGRESAHSSSCDLCSPLPSFPKSIVYGFDFSHPFDQAIYQLKYNRAGYIGGALAELLILKKGLELEAVAKRESLEAIIPIALTRRRQFVRGYNQSQLIAERLGAWLKLPVLGKGLVRRHFSSPQARIPEPELRMENVRGAFAAAPKQLAGRKRFLLVDDVVTTGATIAAATEALHEAGAECVCAVTVCSASKAQQREYLFSEGCAEEIQVQTF